MNRFVLPREITDSQIEDVVKHDYHPTDLIEYLEPFKFGMSHFATRSDFDKKLTQHRTTWLNDHVRTFILSGDPAGEKLVNEWIDILRGNEEFMLAHFEIISGDI